MTKRLREEDGFLENCVDDVLGLLLDSLGVFSFYTMRRVSKKIQSITRLSQKKAVLRFLSACCSCGSREFFHSCRFVPRRCLQNVSVKMIDGKYWRECQLDRSEFGIHGDGESICLVLKIPLCPNWGSSHTQGRDKFRLIGSDMYYDYKGKCFEANGLQRCSLEWSRVEVK
jgi:hypothetical protein